MTRIVHVHQKYPNNLGICKKNEKVCPHSLHSPLLVEVLIFSPFPLMDGSDQYCSVPTIFFNTIIFSIFFYSFFQSIG